MPVLRILFLAGLLFLAVGLFWPSLQKMGFGRLPGDLIVRAGDAVIHFPLVTAFVAGGVVSLLLWFGRGKT